MLWNSLSIRFPGDYHHVCQGRGACQLIHFGNALHQSGNHFIIRHDLVLRVPDPLSSLLNLKSVQRSSRSQVEETREDPTVLLASVRCFLES